MRGVYDYRGECFGFVAKDQLYDLEGKHVGYLTEKAVTSLDHTFIWHRHKDGLYDKHWQSIGYLGAEVVEDQRHE
jgi:hypothetical protein